MEKAPKSLTETVKDMSSEAREGINQILNNLGLDVSQLDAVEPGDQEKCLTLLNQALNVDLKSINSRTGVGEQIYSLVVGA